MLQFHKKLLVLLIGLFSIFLGSIAQADTTTQTVVERRVIETPAPQSMSCTTVKAHWEDNIWVTEQSICKYENRTEGAAWVRDYWACTVYNDVTNACTTWEYKPGHWIKTIS